MHTREEIEKKGNRLKFMHFVVVTKIVFQITTNNWTEKKGNQNNESH